MLNFVQKMASVRPMELFSTDWEQVSAKEFWALSQPMAEECGFLSGGGRISYWDL